MASSYLTLTITDSSNTERTVTVRARAHRVHSSEVTERTSVAPELKLYPESIFWTQLHSVYVLHFLSFFIFAIACACLSARTLLARTCIKPTNQSHTSTPLRPTNYTFRTNRSIPVRRGVVSNQSRICIHPIQVGIPVRRYHSNRSYTPLSISTHSCSQTLK